MLRWLLLTIGLLFSVNLLATHNRSGEITYKQVGPLTIEMTITTYTKTSSRDADRDSLFVLWGDGTTEWVFRVNGENNKGEPLANDIKLNYYIQTHTYPGVGTYTISMKDKNRIGGILNVNFPNSISIPFYVETTITFLSPQFQGLNNSAVLLQPPIDNACVGKRFVHNPNAFDVDGDSLAYELITPREDALLDVPNYVLPNQISPGPDNQIFLDSVNGDFIWDAPQRAGEYNIAIAIKEYRNGILINTIVRDMQILVSRCENEPPEITSEDFFCVVAGEELSFDIIANDPDSGQQVIITALGGPFEQTFSPATLLTDPGYQDIPALATFNWQTTCEHISALEYTVVFKAEDNYLDTTGLVDLKTVRIKVVGPPPLDVTSEREGESIIVSWENPYRCEVTANDYFQGFSVWRRVNSNAFVPDTCQTGLEGRGYTQIAYDVMDISDGRYVFRDDFVEKGQTYCYRVLGEFAQISPGGNPFNRVQSIPSNESCNQLNRDLPFITHVSVEATDVNDGMIMIRWIPPKLPDFDTLENPGPYRMELTRATGLVGSNYQNVAGGSFTFNRFGSTLDTMWIDQGLNTVDNAYNYRINFYTRGGNNLYGSSQPASSIFATLISSDKRNTLIWEWVVPWQYTSFDVLKQNNNTGEFEFLANTTTNEFVDRDVENGVIYCYQVKGFGTYGIPEIPTPQINFSQEICGAPVDTVPPCAPELVVNNICSQAAPSTPEDEFINELNWIVKTTNCDNEQDIAGYNVYYAENLESDFQLVAAITEPQTTSVTHKPDLGISGCYYVTSIDFSGNESEPGNVYCVNDCPEYKLPNAFTPNNDGANDIFIPILSRFIDRIDCKIFNRWGGLVFETSDPLINWDGKNMQGKDLAEGVYYYSCKIFNDSFTAPDSEQVLTGYIQLMR